MSNVSLGQPSFQVTINVMPAVQDTPDAASAADAKRASGAIAGYMNQNGIDSVDPNQLYAMATNAKGDVPEAVQEAAAFMLANPKTYEKIETHDSPGSDGKSSVHNFEQSAQGNIPTGGDAVNSPSAMDSYAPEAAQGSADQAASAAGALGAYMHDKGTGAMTPNKLYELATNKGGEVPEAVQKAASFMLQNPEIYKQIETNDVAGADGKSGAGNFDKAAQGLVELPSAQAGTTGNAELDKLLQQLGVQGPDQSQAASGNQQAASDPMAQLLKLLEKLLQQAGIKPEQIGAGAGAGAGQAATQGDQAASAAGTLGAYMHDKGTGAMTPNKLYELATNKGGEVPEAVQKAANFMLQNPEIYKQIETNDVARADGKSGAGNFDKAAQGLVELQQTRAMA